MSKGESILSEERPVCRKRRRLRAYHILLLALVILVGGYGLLRWRLKSQLQRRMDAIRAAGYPLTWAELDKWYSIPNDVENAAEVILDATLYYAAPNKPELMLVVGQAELPGRTEPLSEDMKQLIGQYLAQNKRALELLGKAASIEHSRYPIDLSAGFAGLMPPYPGEIRDVARLLLLDAIWHAQNNEGDKAVEAVVSIFGVARTLAKEPLINSQLVRFACESIGVSAVERVVNRMELGDEQLARLSETFAQGEDESGLLRGFVGERCVVFEALRDPDGVTPQVFGVPRSMGLLYGAYRAMGLTDKGATIYLDLMDGLFDALRLPEQERIKAAQIIQAERLEVPRIYVMLHMLMPAYSRTFQMSLNNIAGLRIVKVGLAIERYRLANRKLPEKLAELVPAYLDAVPKDPFDGQELRYKRLEKGYVVYSIGKDISDDGGTEMLPPSKRTGGKANWDVTFIVER
jgi:hypothetical protein